jgi:hypothetical protein
MISGWKNRDSSKPLDMEDDLWPLNYMKIMERLYSTPYAYKLVRKTRSRDMVWAFHYLNSEERRDIFKYIQPIEGLNVFLKEIDQEIDNALVPVFISLVFPAIFLLQEAFSQHK